MPTYNFKHKVTGEIVEKFFSFKEREEFIANNPDYEQCHLEMAPLGDPIRLGIRKPDSTFRDILKARKSKNPRAKINTF